VAARASEAASAAELTESTARRIHGNVKWSAENYSISTRNELLFLASSSNIDPLRLGSNITR
jgi:hypothetical protein